MKNDIIRITEDEFNLIKMMHKRPYFIIVQDKDDAYVNISDGFDICYIFDWIIQYAREEEDFKKVLADLIIDLSKEV